ncbi:MAG: RsmB/NOP family class I SAM-dependent RNA methyltransferase [archaeon]
MISPKPFFAERMQKLLGDESKRFFKCCQMPLGDYIRCNTLKVTPQVLIKKLSSAWKVIQPYPDYPQIIKVESKVDGSPLKPGELGKAREHLLGYFYVQELSSMMPVIALNPLGNISVLDLCASPGSKTTQIAAQMQNQGLLMANDSDLGRVIVLNANLEKSGVTNCIVTREDGGRLAEKLHKLGIKFDKILIDTSCSGEGTIMQSPSMLKMWNFKMIKNFARQQKRLAACAFSILKEGGEMIYSTCTLAPEENEEVIEFLLENFNASVQELSLPIKSRPGITQWQSQNLREEIKKCHRIYPQDNNSEGFFIAKLKKNG